jgi:uncharacterized protein DUF4276
VKFILLVEGSTERDSAAAFLKRWLDPQLSQPVGIQVVTFNGYAELTREMVARARMHLEGPRQTEIVAVIGLMDLYGPNFYPAHLTTAEERYTWAKEHFEKQVGLSRFRMFFAVHEFEAWLLSQPDIFPREIQDLMRGKFGQPENVNFDEPPAKRLNRIYQQATKKNYKKTSYGKQLFARLDPSIASKKCPYLRAMLEELLSMARAAGR